MHIRCEGECGATEEHVMHFDKNDTMQIEVSRDEPLSMSNHHPLIAGTFPDRRQSYVFQLFTEGGLVYEASGPSPKEAHFMRRLDGKLFITRSSLPDTLYIIVLRYDLGSYMHCEYYASKLRLEDAGMDPTGPFSWKFERYLPAFYWQHASI